MNMSQLTNDKARQFYFYTGKSYVSNSIVSPHLLHIMFGTHSFQIKRKLIFNPIKVRKSDEHAIKRNLNRIYSLIF